MRRHVRNDSVSPVRDRGSPYRRSSPSRKSQTRTERSPVRERQSRRDSSPLREKHSSRAKSPIKHSRSPSPPDLSPSPRTKRLRRAEAERASGRGERERNDDRRIGKERSRSPKRGGGSPSDRQRKSRHRSRSHSPKRGGVTRDEEKGIEGRGRNQSREGDKGMHRGRGSDREVESERKERRETKDSTTGHRSSRSRHEQSTSPLNGHHRNRHQSRSPQPAVDHRARDEAPESRDGDDGIDDNDSVARMKAAEEALEAQKKQEPSFELSGNLAAETNTFRGITLLYTEPPEARPPTVKWRLYVFKGGEVLKDPLKIHRQSFYLFGRERRVADVPTDHPYCSKQHAVIQFREVEIERPGGLLAKEVKPYVMDIGSTNKTFVNASGLSFYPTESAIEPQRYYELMERDTIKFGNSSREYVLLHENSVDR